MDIEKLTGEQVRRMVRLLSIAYGGKHYAQEHPKASLDEIVAWADQHWKEFEDQAFYLLAVLAFKHEIAEECHWN